MKQEIKERVETIRKGEVPEGYRKTKVGIIPEDWNVFNIDEISEVKSGKRLPKGRILLDSETPHPYIRVTDMYKGGVSLNDIKYLPIDVYPSIKKYRIFKKDIFISVAGTLGVVGIIPEILDGANLTENADRLTNISCNRDFLLFILMSPLIQSVIESESTLGAQPKLALTRIRKFKIPLPEEQKEQLKIAEILSTWDKAIELKEKLIEEKKEFKKGLMQNLLTGKIRFSEFTTEWKTAIIKDVFEEVKRINGNNSKDIDILTISAKHGFLSQKDKFSKVIAGSSLKKYTHLFQNEFAYNKGNSKTAPFGCIFKLDKEGLVPFVYICFRPTQMIDVDFFDFYFKHGLLEHQLKRIITSGARSDGLLNVSKDNFFNIKISFPSIEEQKKIGLVLSLIQNDTDYLIDELTQLKEQKRGLMQLLLTGIVRVEVN